MFLGCAFVLGSGASVWRAFLVRLSHPSLGGVVETAIPETPGCQRAWAGLA